MEIKDISVTRLQHMEHFQFADRVLQLCKEAETAKLTAVLAPLEAAVKKEDEALNQPGVLDGTEELELLDRKRDNAYQSFCLLIEMALRADEEETVKAAKVVNEIMHRYPRAAAANYDKETGMIKNLIADLKEAAAAAALIAIGGDAAATRLAAANTAFDARFHQRISSKMPHGRFDLKALRAETDNALKKVLRRIDALDELEPDAKIAALIEHYNHLVDNRNVLLSQRKASNKSAAEKKTKDQKAMLDPLLREFEKQESLAEGTLSFTGNTKGTGKKRIYELELKGSGEKRWVRIENNWLFWTEDDLKTKK